ncbi:FecCD family ABC transporter permease [Ruania albidiflava]|uniref:FecCD family ABC transporter permease n=1 Tax=Ruania albidiflava TaxID=366586 RepID=UPI0003B65785|nr:iron ABC transporter permease [Ruania albidiflava]
MSAGSDVAAPWVAQVTGLRAGAARRYRVVVLLLVAVVLLLVAVTVLWDVAPAEAVAHLQHLLGLGGDRSFAVRLRLPRAVLSVAVGVAFGLAGALFQVVLRNPLASPDIIGVTGGASLAGAGAILLAGLTGAWVSLAAFGGAAVVAAAILLLSWSGELSGYRFVLVGVGLAFVCQSGIGYLITRSQVDDVRSALVWMVGSIGTPTWGTIGILAACLLLLLPLTGYAGWRLRAMQLGDETAAGLGVRVTRSRLLVLLVGVALAAVATAVAGPVAFVAFMSAPIARRLLPAAGAALLPAALVGAVVVLAAELVAEQLLTGLEVPVGIVTGVVGAPYLLWLLATGTSRRTSR